MRSFLMSMVLALSACGSSEPGEWTTTTEDSLVVGVEITGALKATESISLGPPNVENMWEFKIAALAPEGEVAKIGDMLAVFDASTLQEQRVARMNERESAEVALQKRQVEVRLANQDDALALAEAEAAVRKAAVSADQSEELTGSLALAKAKLTLSAAEETVEHLRAQQKRKRASAQSSLATLRSNVATATRHVERLDTEIASMTLVAERSGTVIYGDNWGNKAKVGDTIWRLGVAVEVASLDSMMAKGVVDEADSAKLKVGQTVRMRLESEPDQEIVGTLTKIAKTLQRKSDTIPTKVVSVELSIEAAGDLKLRPGMRFRGDVETQRLDSAVIAPLAAIFPSPEGPVAYVKTGDGPERRVLELGLRGKRGIEVRKGLKPGDQISRVDLAHASGGQR